MSFSDRDHQYMQQAMELAKESAIDEEVPVGAVLRFENGETFVSGNHREKNGNVLGHCEAVVIQEASKLRGSWRLDKSVLYVTLEPCLSCTGLIYA
ncbi:MAG: nucleoside deaminase, partial [Bdellovibrionales bacterium]|nr:nucleoside deaminase [Bdellovibrionales bacterium]